MPRSLRLLLALSDLSDSGDFTALTESDLSTFSGKFRLGGFLRADWLMSGSFTSSVGLLIALNSVKSRDWLTAEDMWLEPAFISSPAYLDAFFEERPSEVWSLPSLVESIVASPRAELESEGS
jgi:hypothetical protein